MNARRLLLALVLAALAAAGHVEASDRYDPRLKFRTLSTPNFDIHFHQGEEILARRLARIAETAAKALERTLGRPRERVHVILVAQNDQSNGWATPFPFNVIEITAASPRGASIIGNTSNWLRIVFVHEYTHLLHLDRSRGLFSGLRRVFGRNPALMPNLFVPPWQIEGLATFEESAVTREGRVPAGDFRLILNRASAAKRFATLDEASHDRVDWPSGNTRYVYGAYFHQYLADTFGRDTLAQLADETAGRVPYFGSGAFKTVFNRSLGELWRDFEADAGRKAPPESPSSATRLTHHGFTVTDPVYAPNGRLFYSISNPHDFPSLMEWRADASPRRVTTRVGAGRSSAAASTIIFDQVEYIRSVGVQSDLFAADPDSGAVRRLTRGARAADPDLSPDGRTIVCTIQTADRRYLATLELDSPADPRYPATLAPDSPAAWPNALASQAGTHYASPRWSPDGSMIVAERRRDGAASDIVMIDPDTGVLRVVIATHVNGRRITPSWLPGGHVLFASARDGAPFEIYVTDTAGTFKRLMNAGVSAQSPVLSPDGQTLTFVGYTADGFDLFSMPWSEATWLPVSEDTIEPASTIEAVDPGAASDLADTPYRPWAMLRPRFWTPIIEPDGDDTAVGAATQGADALGRHAYAAGAAWSARGADWYAAYAYDRWRPRVFVNASGDTDPWLTGDIRTRELDAGFRVPFRTVRRTQSVFAAVHASSDRFRCETCSTPIDETVTRRALRGGYLLTTAREYGFSISPENGITTTLSTEWTPSASGSSGHATAAVADVRAYFPMTPRHAVVAVRGAAAASWGTDRAARVFGAGGSGPPPAGSSFGRDAIGLIRGFESDDAFGRRVAIANLDYRFPLAWIERGIGTAPVLLRALHGAVFADAGAAWNTWLTRQHRRASAGVELAADVVVGYAVPLTVASGVAWRHDPTGAARGAAWFVRVGRAF